MSKTRVEEAKALLAAAGELGDSDSDVSDSSSDTSRRRSKKHKKKKKKKKKHKKKKERKKKDKKKKSSSRKKKRRKYDNSDDEEDTKSKVKSHISAQDYFAKATEFRVWLQKKHGKFLDEIAKEQAHAIFEDEFVALWNAGKLPAAMYDGIDALRLETSALTRHRWGFAAQLSEEDKLRAQSVRDQIDTATSHSYAQEFGRGKVAAGAAAAAAAGAPGRSEAGRKRRREG